MNVCVVCGAAIPATGKRGRPKVACSEACRKAHDVAWHKRWREANRDSVAASSKRWAAANRDKVAAINKRAYERRKAELAELRRKVAEYEAGAS